MRAEGGEPGGRHGHGGSGCRRPCGGYVRVRGDPGKMAHEVEKTGGVGGDV